MLNLVGKNSLQVNWRILWHVTTSSPGIPDHNHAALSLNKKSQVPNTVVSAFVDGEILQV